MRFNNVECTDIWFQLFIPVMQFDHWLVIVMNLEVKRIDVLSSAPMVDPMHSTQLAKNISFFLKVLFRKAYARHGVDVKTLEPQYADIPHHNNV